MSVRAYYNEFDPKAAAWLRELIKRGHITDGTVDERSINEVQPTDLVGFDRCHFFAGIGGWELALKLADWGDSSVWTGSCPCQPFSDAGQQKGIKDERHLWPEFFRLIKACQPGIIFGEQVASSKVVGSVAQARKHSAKRPEVVWLDGVFTDLEGENYTCGSAVLGAHSVGSPHIRQRLYWVANTSSAERGRWAQSEREHGRALHTANRCGAGGMANASSLSGPQHERESGVGSRREAGPHDSTVCGGTVERMANTSEQRCAGQHALLRSDESGWVAADLPEVAGNGSIGIGTRNAASDNKWRSSESAMHRERVETGGSGGDSGLGDAISQGPQRLTGDGDCWGQSGRLTAKSLRPVAETSPASFWSYYDLIPCRDGKARRIESGTFPLAHGVPARVVRLRGFGNAIVPQTAAAFIRAFKQVQHVTN